MGAFIDLTGRKIGRLTIVKRAPNKGKKTMWEYKCDCGNTGVSNAGDISVGRVSSCGCYNREVVTKHGGSSSRIYQTYHDMIQRCYNPRNKAFKNYGGRGIAVCDEWRNSFEEFHDWALSNGYRDDLTIDRRDNDGPYSPENCQWVTMGVQASNTRRNVFVEACGQKHTYAQWSRIIGVSRQNTEKGVKKYGAAYIEKKIMQQTETTLQQ